MNQKLTIGRIVHHTRAMEDWCLPAMVTAIKGDGVTGLVVFGRSPERPAELLLSPIVPLTQCPPTLAFGGWHWSDECAPQLQLCEKCKRPM